MARRAYFTYVSYLLEVMEALNRYDPNFTMRDWPETRVEAIKIQISDLNDEITIRENQLEILKTQRDMQCKTVDGFAVTFRAALIADFGSKSREVEEMPRLLKRGPGRPRKAVATRRKNALAKKKERGMTENEVANAGLEANSEAE